MHRFLNWFAVFSIIVSAALYNLKNLIKMNDLAEWPRVTWVQAWHITFTATGPMRLKLRPAPVRMQEGISILTWLVVLLRKTPAACVPSLIALLHWDIRMRAIPLNTPMVTTQNAKSETFQVSLVVWCHQLSAIKSLSASMKTPSLQLWVISTCPTRSPSSGRPLLCIVPLTMRDCSALNSIRRSAK